MKRISLILLLILVSTLSANDSKLFLKKKLSVIPYLSDINGEKWSENTEFKKNDNIFISFIPSGKWQLKERHRKKYFNKIVIQ